MNSYVYIMTGKDNSILYVGVTSNLVKRVYEHRNKLMDGFTKRYNLDKLVYFEIFDDIRLAITREKQIKNWHRDWKIDEITKFNPNYSDLYGEILK